MPRIRCKKFILILFAILVVLFYNLLIESTNDSEEQIIIHKNPYKYDIDDTQIRNPHKFQLSINPGYDICKNDDILFVAIIFTAPESFEVRQAARQTWANANRFPKARFLFPFGFTDDTLANELIKNESDTYRDIIQEESFDSYYTLTIKLLSSLKWINDYCPQSTYIIKLNHDVVLNTFSIIKYLEILRDKEITKNTWFGRMYVNAKPIRNPESKYYVSKEEYNVDRFPNFCEGSIYFLTTDLAIKYFQLSRIHYIKRISDWMDDVQLGIISEMLDVDMFDISNYLVPYDQHIYMSLKEKINEIDKRKANRVLAVFSDSQWSYISHKLSLGVNYTETFES